MNWISIILVYVCLLAQANAGPRSYGAATPKEGGSGEVSPVPSYSASLAFPVQSGTAQVRRIDIAEEHARHSLRWVRDAVIYEVYPRSFSRSKSLLSIIRRLPEIKELGVTVIWLMPVHPIGKLDRKGPLGSPYSVEDYYKINPEYGRPADFEKLVKAVHAEGLHIIMDLVADHTA